MTIRIDLDPYEPRASRSPSLAAALAVGCDETTDVTGKAAPPPPPRHPRQARQAPARPRLHPRARARGRPGLRPAERPPVAWLRTETPFGEPRTLGIAKVRDERRWLGVHSPVFANDEIGWIPNDPPRST